MQPSDCAWNVLTGPPTPIVAFNLPGLRLLAKLEYLQPGESVKARIGRALVDRLLAEGRLTARTGYLVEVGAGNTAIALALALQDIQHHAAVVSVVSDKVSAAQVARMQRHGIDVRIMPYTVAPKPGEGLPPLLAYAESVAGELPGAVLAGQFFSEANPSAHERTTGPEILAQLSEPPDVIVLGVGTGGTLTGVGRILRRAGWPTRIILADPQGSIIGAAWQGEPAIAGKSIVSGIGGDFVPPILDLSLIDEVISVPDDATCAVWHWFRTYGFPIGSSSACAVAAALAWSRHQQSRPSCLVVFADHGGHYTLPPVEQPDGDRQLELVAASVAADRPASNEVSSWPRVDEAH
jgi:cystathionine beta-synthase